MRLIFPTEEMASFRFCETHEKSRLDNNYKSFCEAGFIAGLLQIMAARCDAASLMLARFETRVCRGRRTSSSAIFTEEKNMVVNTAN